jgi:hypothetical protein
MRAMLYRVGVPAVSYDDVGEMRSVPEIFFGMTRLATLLPSLGSAKLLRHSWIYVGKQVSAS